MAKLKIKLVDIYAPRDEEHALMKRLQEMSVIDIDTAAHDSETGDCPEGFGKTDTAARVATYERNLSVAESAIKILDERCPEKKGLLAMFSGPRTVSRDEFYMSREKVEASLALSNAVVNSDRYIAEQRAEITRLKTTADQMRPWEKLDVPLSFSGTVKTAAFIGSVAGCYDLEGLLAAIAEKSPELCAYAEIVYQTKDSTCIFVSCPASDRQKAEDALRELSFARPLQLTSKLPADKIASKERRITECEERISESLKKISDAAASRSEIELFLDYCRVRADRYSAMGETAHTEHTVRVRGYVAEVDIPYLEKVLEKEFTVVIETADVNEDLAPVRLHNNAFSAPAEMITEMYSLPSRHDIDPTPLTGFFYYLLFGMMLSDAGYGLLMIIGTLLILTKLKPSPSMRRSMKLFLYCGISTFLWGAAFGSFFGDIIPSLSRTYFGHEVNLPALIDPMNGGAVTLLVLSLAIGFVQIIAGLVAKFITSMKNGDKAGAFFDSGLWITALSGIALLAVGAFAAPALISAGAVISIASAAGLILTQGRDKKNPVMRILSGVISLYDISGFVSDLLSFSRLMALGLTTAAMGAVFNLLGTLGGKSVGGVVLLIIIFPVGHGISFALNALGAYVHTLRLQYVELFSKFYEGGGREFKAFSFKNKYVGLNEPDKEEN